MAQFETRYNLNDSIGYPQQNNSTVSFIPDVIRQGRIVAFKITEAGVYYLILDNESLSIVKLAEKDIPETFVSEVAASLGNPQFPNIESVPVAQ